MRIEMVRMANGDGMMHGCIVLLPRNDWHIGRDSLDRQVAQGWGAKVIDQLARDLTAALPDMKGFARRNLLSMWNFAEDGLGWNLCNTLLHYCPGDTIS